jgi:hypothetical protein
VNNIKIWLQKLTLGMFSLAFILLIGECLFHKYLHKIPFRLYGGVETNLRVLAQYSKQSILPQNYIAILGDSNSIGVGDLYTDLTQNSKNWYPDYAPAHFINKQVGIDVISFGWGGAGSLDGIWTHPVNQFSHINSIGFDLQSPKTILVFFYEGNDLGNNLQLIRENYKGNESIGELLHSVKFNEWLNLQLQNSTADRRDGFVGDLLFVKFLVKSVKNIFFEKSKNKIISETASTEEKLFSHVIINGKPRLLVDSPGTITFPSRSVSHVVINDKAIPVATSDRIRIPEKSITQAVINGKTEPLPGNLQPPPVSLWFKSTNINELLEDKLKVSYFIFEESIKKMKEFFSDSEIKIIYQPSVLSTYKIISPLVSFKSSVGTPGVVDYRILLQRHLEVCREILKISQKLGIGFFDSTKYLLNASSKGYIHGPKDWAHLNESGYRAFSDSIAQFILHPDEPYQTCEN